MRPYKQVEDSADVQPVEGEAGDHLDERVEVAEEEIPPAAVLKGPVQEVVPGHRS